MRITRELPPERRWAYTPTDLINSDRFNKLSKILQFNTSWMTLKTRTTLGLMFHMICPHLLTTQNAATITEHYCMKSFSSKRRMIGNANEAIKAYAKSHTTNGTGALRSGLASALCAATSTPSTCKPMEEGLDTATDPSA